MDGDIDVERLAEQCSLQRHIGVNGLLGAGGGNEDSLILGEVSDLQSFVSDACTVFALGKLLTTPLINKILFAASSPNLI